MDKLQIFRQLEVHPAEIFITHIDFNSWGQNVTLKCVYDLKKQWLFEISFTGCRKIIWNSLDDELAINDKVIDVIALTLGRSGFEESSVIHTEAFEIMILYKEITIIKNW